MKMFHVENLAFCPHWKRTVRKCLKFFKFFYKIILLPNIHMYKYTKAQAYNNVASTKVFGCDSSRT